MMRPRRAGSAVLLLLALAACTSGTGPDEPSTAPAGRSTSPSPTPTDKETAIEPVRRNGRITTAERYLGEELHGYDWRGFDPVSETALLFLTPDEGHGPMGGLAVLKPTGRVATLTCGRVLRCGPTGHSGFCVATLGPEADAVTVAPGDLTAKVIGYDGTLRQRMDLTSTVTAGARVRGLRWSPDGSRLAVLTEQEGPPASAIAWRATRMWVLDREGGDARLAYTFLASGPRPDTFDAPDFDGRGSIWFPGWGWSWSPDGQSLLLDVLTGGPDGTADGPAVVVLRLPPHGAVDPVDAQTLYRSDRISDCGATSPGRPTGPGSPYERGTTSPRSRPRTAASSSTTPTARAGSSGRQGRAHGHDGEFAETDTAPSQRPGAVVREGGVELNSQRWRRGTTEAG